MVVGVVLVHMWWVRRGQSGGWVSSATREATGVTALGSSAFTFFLTQTLIGKVYVLPSCCYLDKELMFEEGIHVKVIVPSSRHSESRHALR